MPLFKKNQRYKVSRRSDFIQVVTLLDGTQMECNLSVDCLPSDCLENVLQRLEVHEIDLFGLKYFTTGSQLRWADFDRPLKKQLEKNASSASQVMLGIFYYIDRAYALHDEATRYQYYLQLKADVLDSKLYCSLEQAILLAGYALQAEYQNYDDARQSDEYIKEIERLDTTLLPRNLVSEYDSHSALADIAQHIVSSHMALTDMSTSQAEIAYIHLAQQMDGCGVEYAKASSTEGAEIYLCSSSSGITIRRQNGQITQEFHWPQISELSATKKYLHINMTNKKLSTKSLLDDPDTAKYVHRIFSLQQEFYNDTSHTHLLYSDDELSAQQDNSEPLLSPDRHERQLSNLSATELYDSSTLRANRENAVDVIEEEPSNASSTQDVNEASGHNSTDLRSSGATPDILDTQYEDDYATMKFKSEPISERPRAQTASLYVGSSQTPMLDQLHKNEMLHRSMTALQEYRDNLDQQQQQGQSVRHTAESFLAQSQPRSALIPQYAGSADHLNLHSSYQMAAASMLSRSMHGLELSSQQNNNTGVPSYRPSPDYDQVMRERSMHARAYMPEAYNQQQTVRELQGGINSDHRSLFAQYSSSQHNLNSSDTKEPLYANIQQFPDAQHNEQHSIVDRDQQPTPYQNHTSAQQFCSTEQQYYHQYNATAGEQYHHGDITYQDPHSANNSPRLGYGAGLQATPDLMREIQNQQLYLQPDIINPSKEPVYIPESPDVISRRHLKPPAPSPQSGGQGLYKSFGNLALLVDGGEGRRSGGSDRSAYSGQSARSSRSDRSAGNSPHGSARSNHSAREELSPHLGSRLGSAMSSHSHNQISKPSLDERVVGLQDKLNNDSIAAEYESVDKKRQPSDCRVALRPENESRNRFHTYVPYEETRVRLLATPTNPHGYINASHVQMAVGSEKLTYIATQNPFDNTLQDFWTMIWMHNVSIITMVTELEERGTQKCPRYWPQVAGLQNAKTVKDLKIVLKHSASAQNFTTSCLRVIKTSTKEQRTIWHIQYTDWHQKGCPTDVHGFLALLDELNSVRLHIQTKKHTQSPCMLVHCSTGVGRSGVVILSDVMRKCLENNEQISVASTLRELRQQRMYMVQTPAQYKFVHEVLVHYLKGVRLI